MIALIGFTAAAAPIALDRIDLLSEDPGRWLSEDLPRVGVLPGLVGARFLTQIRPVVALSGTPVSVGLSIQSQSVLVEVPLVPRAHLSMSGALITRTGLPSGASVGLGWRPGRVRLGLSAVVVSSATWADPTWQSWDLLPGIGFGIGRDIRPRAPWMEG